MARIQLLSKGGFADLLSGPAPIVRGTHFQPSQQIRLEISCRDGRGRPWKSTNFYQANKYGVFETSLSPATSQSYQRVPQEEPFTSMTCELGTGYDFSGEGLDRITYTVTCFLGTTEIWTRPLTRNVARERPRRDFAPWARVRLFEDPVGLHGCDVAANLAAYGIAVTNHGLDDCSRPRAEPDGAPAAGLPTFIVGSGRASARALEAAIRMSGIRAVILFSGSGLRFGPAAHNEPGAQSDEAEPDFIELATGKLQPGRDGLLCTRPLYVEALADRQMFERATIKVEYIACPIYMFSGLDDQIWPASAFSELIIHRREEKSCPFLTWHRVFEGAGHDLGPSLGWPTFPTSERSTSHPDCYARLRLGGTAARQARARRECWDGFLRILMGQGPRAPFSGSPTSRSSQRHAED